MEKLKMESVDMTQKNIEKLGLLFPNVITEMIDEEKSTPEKTVYKKGINFELLKQELLSDVVEREECYDFTWAGKNTAIVEGNKPIRKTLRPCVNESKDWETTGNLYIEGDNLDVLKLLQESYLNSIKMIYIDPPYNTGKDSFVYSDKFIMDSDDYEALIEYRDEEGNIQFRQNNETNPRFHSDWCNMLYPRLKLAMNLLSEDGVIFISIDDHEVDNLKKICNEIFGEKNFIACISNINNPKGRSDNKFVAPAHEYILMYQKGNSRVFGWLPEDNVLRRYNKIDENGETYREIDLRKTGDNDRKEDRPNLFYYFYYNEKTKDLFASYEDKEITDYVKIFPTRKDGVLGNWRWQLETAMQKKHLLIPKYSDTGGKWMMYVKDILSDDLRIKPTTAWSFKDVNSERGTEQFISLGFDKNIFPKPKPLGTVYRCAAMTTRKDDLILDFFSGSSTTAQAVMQLNVEDGGNRKYIMVQLPERCDEKSEAYRVGFSSICEIGKERIRRAGDKINDVIIKQNSLMEDGEEVKPLVDIGFRVLKVDSTNMNDVYYAANEYSQDMLIGLESNIKEDRTDLDLLYGVLLDWGLQLSLKHKIEEIDGVTVHTVDEGSLVACFAERVSESIVREIAKRQPLRVVFRDSCFASSPDKINVEEIFKLHAPNTTVKVI